MSHSILNKFAPRHTIFLQELEKQRRAAEQKIVKKKTLRRPTIAPLPFVPSKRAYTSQNKGHIAAKKHFEQAITALSKNAEGVAIKNSDYATDWEVGRTRYTGENPKERECVNKISRKTLQNLSHLRNGL